MSELFIKLSEITFASLLEDTKEYFSISEMEWNDLSVAAQHRLVSEFHSVLIRQTTQAFAC